MTQSNLTMADFVAVLQGNMKLWDLIERTGAMEQSNRGNGRITIRTDDIHAAHAVEILANRAGLKVLSTQTDDWTRIHSVGVTGFAQAHIG